MKQSASKFDDQTVTKRGFWLADQSPMPCTSNTRSAIRFTPGGGLKKYPTAQDECVAFRYGIHDHYDQRFLFHSNHWSACF